MTNQEAIQQLDELVEAAQAVVQAAVWASAFLTAGGEPTWDAVKSVSYAASTVYTKAIPVCDFDQQYEEIIP